jgi:hypothetical protein
MNDKNIEVEVLKEMIKGMQIQLKAREQDVIRMSKRIQQVEGQKLS